MVLAVDQGDVHRRLGQPLCGGQTAEPGADDDHARALAVRAGARHELQAVLFQRLRRARGHALFLPAIAHCGWRCPERDRRVELGCVKPPGLGPGGIADEASEPRGAVEEARRWQAAARLADDDGRDEGTAARRVLAMRCSNASVTWWMVFGAVSRTALTAS